MKVFEPALRPVKIYEYEFLNSGREFPVLVKAQNKLLVESAEIDVAPLTSKPIKFDVLFIEL